MVHRHRLSINDPKKERPPPWMRILSGSMSAIQVRSRSLTGRLGAQSTTDSTMPNDEPALFMILTAALSYIRPADLLKVCYQNEDTAISQGRFWVLRVLLTASSSVLLSQDSVYPGNLNRCYIRGRP